MKNLFLFFFLIVCLPACKKESKFDATAQATADDAAIQTYIKANNIPATKDASGLYYQILASGAGSNPTVSSTVQVNYTGKLLDGTIFDQTTASTGSRYLALNNTIQGWQIGIPYLKPGGRILLLIPSALGYGNTATGPIPANSVLIFTIDLLSTK